MQTCIWPSWCHYHSLSLASVKYRLVLPFWHRPTRVVPEKGPLNGCVCYMYETLFVGNMWRASVGADVTQSTAPVTVGAAGCHCHITRTSQAQLLHPSSNFTHACCIHTHVNVNQMEYSSLQLTSSLRELTCHMGTQCCLPPRRTDIPTFTPTTAGTRFCDHRGMQDLTSWLHTKMVNPPKGSHPTQ